jgi:hypothetical protein
VNARKGMAGAPFQCACGRKSGVEDVQREYRVCRGIRTRAFLRKNLHGEIYDGR